MEATAAIQAGSSSMIYRPPGLRASFTEERCTRAAQSVRCFALGSSHTFLALKSGHFRNAARKLVATGDLRPAKAAIDEFQVEFEELSKNLAQNGKQAPGQTRAEAVKMVQPRPAAATFSDENKPKPIPVARKVKAVGNNTEDLLNNLLQMINELKVAIEEKDKKILELEKSSKSQQDREIKISALARENAVLLDELKAAQDKNTRLELQVSQCIQLLRQLIDSQERVIPVLKEIIDDQDTKRKV